MRTETERGSERSHMEADLAFIRATDEAEERRVESDVGSSSSSSSFCSCCCRCGHFSAHQHAIYELVLAVLCHARCQHQHWFDDDDAAISNLPAEKNCLHKAYVTGLTDDNKAAFYRSLRLVQQRLRETQGDWTFARLRRSKVTRTATDRKDFSGQQSADSSTLQILRRWTEHFRGVLNRPSTNYDTAFAHLTPIETNANLDLLPSLHKAIGVMQRLFSGKASGSDAIPAEIYKYGGP
ncbi:hypothetical protein SprV_0301008100 [Sparganum proliferum]